MFTRYLLVLMIALCLFGSCKKNSSSNSSGTSDKLKLYIESATTSGVYQVDTFAVAYDDNNRIVSLTSPSLTFDYAYSGNSFTLDLYDYSIRTVHEIAYINSSSYVDSTFQFDNTSDTTTEGYTYKGSELTRLMTYNYSSSGSTIYTEDDYAYDNNGDEINDVNSDGYGDINTIFNYTYTTYPLKVRIDPTYIPALCKYLPATLSWTDGQGDPQGSITFSYAFDTSGRLTKETDSTDNGDIATKTYVYQ